MKTWLCDHLVTALMVAVVFLVGVAGTVWSYQKECADPRVVEGVVTDRYVKADSRSHSHHRPDVFYVTIHEDSGVSHVLRNHDSLWWWKFDSADTQAKLRVGERVRVTIAGYRWPFWSLFPNIVSAERIR